AEESPDRLAAIEHTLKLRSPRLSRMDASVSQSILELEEKLGSQSEIVDSLRAAVQQNEEMLETLADSMNIVDDLGTRNHRLLGCRRCARLRSLHNFRGKFAPLPSDDRRNPGFNRNICDSCVGFCLPLCSSPFPPTEHQLRHLRGDRFHVLSAARGEFGVHYTF